MPSPLPGALSKASRSSLPTIRAFSTTTARPAIKIPPESPTYINVPNPPLNQNDELTSKPGPRDYKGSLPIPRVIFKEKRGTPPKTDPAFIKKSAPLPTSPQSQREPPSEYVAWKRRMADNRRKNLTEGITQLSQRQTETARQKRAKETALTRRHDRARDAPQREDERLTQSSIPAVLLETAVPLDPLRFDKALESQERTRRILEAKSQDRISALQHLYMSARHFIVDEDVMNKEIDDIFTPEHFGKNCENVWDAEGAPPTVREMLGVATKSDARAVAVNMTEEAINQKRQEIIAAELTGGPLVV